MLRLTNPYILRMNKLEIFMNNLEVSVPTKRRSKLVRMAEVPSTKDVSNLYIGNIFARLNSCLSEPLPIYSIIP